MSYFNIPPKGVVIVLEKENYSNYPNHIWRQIALHLNIKDGGIEGMSPEHLLEIMESRKYAHLIWLSKEACESSDIDFTWILAHELRHLEQDLLSSLLSKASHFILHALGQINIDEPKVDNIIPTELDANLRSWNLARKIFIKKVADKYVKNKGISGTEDNKQNFQILMQHNPDESYDFIERTVSLMMKYKTQLEKFQQSSQEDLSADFDIDQTCKNLRVTR